MQQVHHFWWLLCSVILSSHITDNLCKPFSGISVKSHTISSNNKRLVAVLEQHLATWNEYRKTCSGIGTTPCFLKCVKLNPNPLIDNRLRWITPELGNHIQRKTTTQSAILKNKNYLKPLAAILAVQALPKEKLVSSFTSGLTTQLLWLNISTGKGTALWILSDLARTLWL